MINLMLKCLGLSIIPCFITVFWIFNYETIGNTLFFIVLPAVLVIWFIMIYDTVKTFFDNHNPNNPY